MAYPFHAVLTEKQRAHLRTLVSSGSAPAADPSPHPAQGRSQGGRSGYVRGGVANLFLITEPLRGWRHVTVSWQRTRVDLAHCVRDMVDVHYPDAERIVLVCDHLTTHATASLYATFPPHEARRLTERLEWHHTPMHGSWLNMTELDLSVLARQCLTQRLPNSATMARAVTAWADRRNVTISTIDRHFTTADARTRLRRLYPAFNG